MLMAKDFLLSLLSTSTVSGFEQRGCDLFETYLKQYVDKCHRDVVGNSIVKLGCQDGSKSMLIEAHIDEIGFQVLYIGDDGGIFLRANGGIDMHCVPGSHVEIHGKRGKINGVIGKTPIHLLKSKDRENVIELSNLWVDTGLLVEEVKEKVRVGDPVSFKSNTEFLGEHRITSKALDDKIGVYIVAEVIRRLYDCRDGLKCQIYGAATVQEETGCRGVQTSSFAIMPDIAICIDVDFATDVHGCRKNKFGDVSLGNGVVISYCLDSDMSVADKMISIAEEKGIPVQISARPHATGGTNASRVRFLRSGIKTILLGIPCRYMHTPVEVCDLRDVESAIKLIVEYVKSFSDNQSATGSNTRNYG